MKKFIIKYSTRCKKCGEKLPEGVVAYGQPSETSRKWEIVCENCYSKETIDDMGALKSYVDDMGVSPEVPFGDRIVAALFKKSEIVAALLKKSEIDSKQRDFKEEELIKTKTPKELSGMAKIKNEAKWGF